MHQNLRAFKILLGALKIFWELLKNSDAKTLFQYVGSVVWSRVQALTFLHSYLQPVLSSTGLT